MIEVNYEKLVEIENCYMQDKWHMMHTVHDDSFKDWLLAVHNYDKTLQDELNFMEMVAVHGPTDWMAELNKVTILN